MFQHDYPIDYRTKTGPDTEHGFTYLIFFRTRGFTEHSDTFSAIFVAAPDPELSQSRRSKRKRQQDPFPAQLFLKYWTVARLLKTLFDKEIQIPPGSDRAALFLLLCDSVSARPIFSTRRRAPARSVAASTAHVTTTEPPASIAETQQLPAAEDAMAELHQKIMNDMKQFMQPFTNALSAINSRLDGIDNRSTTVAVPPSASHVPISALTSTASSVSAAPLLKQLRPCPRSHHPSAFQSTT
ncbi:UNVERIFIED_CONTAM: hypothetical protein FKN15_048506 [Acipenser sinensis]